MPFLYDFRNCDMFFEATVTSKWLRILSKLKRDSLDSCNMQTELSGTLQQMSAVLQCGAER